MSELLMSKDIVRQTYNLFPKIEHLLSFDERVAVKAFLNGSPTDDQQMIVLTICKAIIESKNEWDVKNGNNLS